MRSGSDDGSSIIQKTVSEGKPLKRIHTQSSVPTNGSSFFEKMWTDASGMQAHPLPTEMNEADIADTIAEYAGAARANADLDAQRGDLVAFGRPYIANPDLVTRLQHNQALAAADPATFYTPGEQGYTVF